MKLTVYNVDTNEIKAHIEVPTVNEASYLLEEGFGLVEGHFEAADYYINPKTGRPNLHKSDATRPKIPLDRQWSEVKNIRNDLLDQSRWATDSETPLTPECRELWAAYRTALNEVTWDVEDPSQVVFPEEPAIELRSKPSNV